VAAHPLALSRAPRPFGLRQGNRGARIVAIMLGAVALPAGNTAGGYGLALIV
jgi:hypothetical protein